MNYTVEDDYDFYSELNNVKEEDKIDNTAKCLISHTPLIYNAITLPCKHTFNYLPLYTELITQAKKADTKLIGNNIICPYCRVVSKKLLPFIPLPNVDKIIGINSPKSKCLLAPKCSWIITAGTNKHAVCGADGIEYADGIYCNNHYKKQIVNDGWTVEMETLFKTKIMVELKKMLREKKLQVSGTKKELVRRLITGK